MKGRVKKITKRIIAYVLTASMIAGMIVVTPPLEVSAGTIKLKSGGAAPSVVYIGRTYTLDVQSGVENFYSSNKDVATIGKTTGKLKPKAPGMVKITAKSESIGRVVATKTFTVYRRAESISTEQKSYYIKNIGDTVKIKAAIQPEKSAARGVFCSADETIATFGKQSGIVTCTGYGRTTVSVYAEDADQPKDTDETDETDMI